MYFNLGKENNKNQIAGSIYFLTSFFIMLFSFYLINNYLLKEIELHYTVLLFLVYFFISMLTIFNLAQPTFKLINFIISKTFLKKYFLFYSFESMFSKDFINIYNYFNFENELTINDKPSNEIEQKTHYNLCVLGAFDLPFKYNKDLIDFFYSCGYTAGMEHVYFKDQLKFHKFVLESNYKQVKYFIENENIKPELFALDIACYNNDLEMVKLLLEYDYIVEFQYVHHNFLYQKEKFIIQNKNIDIFKEFLKLPKFIPQQNTFEIFDFNNQEELDIIFNQNLHSNSLTILIQYICLNKDLEWIDKFLNFYDLKNIEGFYYILIYLFKLREDKPLFFLFSHPKMQWVKNNYAYKEYEKKIDTYINKIKFNNF